jgi:hypothetical protein
MTTVRGFDTASAVRRFLALFPSEERMEARSRLARVLRFLSRNSSASSGRSLAGGRGVATRGAVNQLPRPPTAVGGGHAARRRARRSMGLTDARTTGATGDIELETAIANAVLPRQLEPACSISGGRP